MARRAKKMKTPPTMETRIMTRYAADRDFLFSDLTHQSISHQPGGTDRHRTGSLVQQGITAFPV